MINEVIENVSSPIPLKGLGVILETQRNLYVVTLVNSTKHFRKEYGQSQANQLQVNEKEQNLTHFIKPT